MKFQLLDYFIRFINFSAKVKAFKRHIWGRVFKNGPSEIW